jgi:hypothetical protein
LTPADLAALLAPTYAEAVDVDLDEALERMTRALASPAIADDLYQCVSAALSAAQGSRSENELMDKLGRSVPKRRGRITFVSGSSSCEGKTMVSAGPIGYVYSTNATGRRAVYRCVRSGDHYVSTSATCEVGIAPEGVLGYWP